jgi:hypothetical protein
MPRRLRSSSRPFLSVSASSTLGLAAVSLASCFAIGCSSGGGSPGTSGTTPPVVGQTAFESSPLPNQPGGGGSSFGATENAGAAAPTSGGSDTVAGASSGSTTRTVQETDLYRVAGNYLYYLNSYRGLMVFDITNIDAPKLVGRHEIFGSPIDMVVNDGFAVVIVSDWYGVAPGGAPFYGSIVRGLDVTDPTNIKVAGEAQLGGDVVDSRVVGNVLYTVAENYSYSYGWYGGGVGVSNGIAVPVGGGVGGGGSSSDVVVTSVSFANNTITPVGQQTFTGYSGVINVNADSIMLAHDLDSNGAIYDTAGTSELQYINIADPGGKIVLGGKMQVPGDITGWGADNGRWNLDFADDKTAHVLTATNDANGNSGYTLSTVDFSNPTAPAMESTLAISTAGWSPTARFDTGRMYLAPDSSYWDGTNTTTPIQIYDLSAPAAPKLAGQTSINGSVWLFMPSDSGNGKQLFALGNSGTYDYTNGASVALNYLDVTNEAAPTVIGTSTFGSGWAWSPAATTFKAFTLDTTQGLAAIPFSGWSDSSDVYNNGVQLIEFTPSSIKTGGAAKTHGWVERGIFANGRLLSLSDLALTVSNYTDPNNPQVVNEITLARNIVDATPDGTTVAELSSDWWGNDTSTSEMRVLPLAQATESADIPGAITASIPGVDARVYRNGNFAYVVSDVNVPAPCTDGNGGTYPVAPGDGTGGADAGAQTCTALTVQMTVVDLSNGGAKLRGNLTLPLDASTGEWGYEWFDWYGGTDEVQVGGSTLAFRRWNETYTQDGQWTADQKMYILDASNPDAPKITATTIAPEQNDWWGNMQVVGDTLYTNHYEWDYLPTGTGEAGRVRYYLDQMDLSDPSNPKVGRSFNVPGLLVGGNPNDPTELYTIDYRWDSDHPRNELDVIKIDNGSRKATLESRTPIGGWVGNVYTQGTKLYTTVTHYDWDTANTTPWSGPTQQLLQIDVSNAAAPALSMSAPSVGWGWLLGLAGDRALVSSGWENNDVDVYQLGTGAPTYSQTIRMNGWGVNTVKRQGNTLYLTTGYWGVQTATLQ